MRKTLLILAFLLVGLGLTAQNSQLQKVDSKHFKRLYKLNDLLYRSEQPNKKGFAELEEMGIKTIINFRRKVDDANRTKSTAFKLERFPLKASELNEDQIIEALKLIQTAEKPVLIHCWHGSDRTGAISAAYRMVIEDWTKEEAISEMRLKELSHHEKRYPNVIQLLEAFDVESVRAAIDN